jgi:glycosyltransferase involved in cell wall biosynthesis
MWLLNHTTAREFEVPMLKSIGIKEIFLPKMHPQEIEFRSASITYEEDAGLSIPVEDLAVLNEQNWYAAPSKKAWDIANRHFDLLFFICNDSATIPAVANNFRGSVLWRAYGLPKGLNYDGIAKLVNPNEAVLKIRMMGGRFWFAEAYPHLHLAEPEYLARRQLYLPLGMPDATMHDQWNGNDRRIFFVCPDVAVNSYYRKIYEFFRESFAGLPYVIGGAQGIDPRQSGFLGFVPNEVHKRNMREFRLMFYHSTEPNHLHFHPLEAVRAGMPLLFMAGGMLDRLGGRGLPGRCRDVAEAQSKAQRMLDGDQLLIERVRKSQVALLESMTAERCRTAWSAGIELVLDRLAVERSNVSTLLPRRKRIAIILPLAYRGGSLRGAKLLARAVYEGSRQCNEAAEVVFLHIDDPKIYSDADFEDLHEGVDRRTYTWKIIPASTARRAMRYAGHEGWEPSAPHYLVPNDDIADLSDCDAWIIISDRLTDPMLPLRPYVLMVYDYIQRYVPVMPPGADRVSLDAAREAAMVWVTTDFTHGDALQYAGVSRRKLAKLPMLVPDFSCHEMPEPSTEPDYFVWTTNNAVHKNHRRALSALKIYYEELGGRLKCWVTGVGTENLLRSRAEHLKEAADIIRGSKVLRENLQWMGELSDGRYRVALSNAAFLWHPVEIDNGTFSVVEAATLGVPSLSGSYPAMREMNERFQLGLCWMNQDQPREMAERLKEMEVRSRSRSHLKVAQKTIKESSVTSAASEYWSVLRECL